MQKSGPCALDPDLVIGSVERIVENRIKCDWSFESLRDGSGLFVFFQIITQPVDLVFYFTEDKIALEAASDIFFTGFISA